MELIKELEYVTNYQTLGNKLMKWGKESNNQEIKECKGCLAEIGIYVAHLEYERRTYEKTIESKRTRTMSKHKERKQMPVFTGVLKYFPNALKYVSKISYIGNQQHHPDKPLHWDKSKSTDQLDALTRHLIDHTTDPLDDDGMLHLGKVAWRALAALEDQLEKGE